MFDGKGTSKSGKAKSTPKTGGSTKGLEALFSWGGAAPDLQFSWKEVDADMVIDVLEFAGALDMLVSFGLTRDRRGGRVSVFTNGKKAEKVFYTPEEADEGLAHMSDVLREMWGRRGGAVEE